MGSHEVVELARALNNERPGENWDANKRVQWNLCVKAVAGVVYDAGHDRDGFIFGCGGLFNV